MQNRKADDMNQVLEKGNIKMKTLDEICSSLDKIDLLKIDVEGYELEVLRGGVSTLKKTNKIIIEILDEFTNNLEQTPHIIYKFLKEKNFRVLEDLGNGNVLFERY